MEVPLPGSPLKATNCYVVKGKERCLIIDTGWNREDCRTALRSGLRRCAVDLEKADFLVTHMHADHLGLVSALATRTARIYSGGVEPGLMSSSLLEHWGKQSDFARKHGFCPKELERVSASHPGHKYSSRARLDFSVLREGETVRVGDYLFECIETPGHTRGHICLYEPEKRILISGDHILIDITSNISLWSEEGNPLEEYLKSLDKVYDLDVELVLPGHRSVFRGHRKRIRELKQHHQWRLGEVLGILKKGEQDVFEIASQMTWDVDYGSWDSFPPSQKWFAFGEAMAHLKYLEELKKVGRKKTQKEVIKFFLEESNG